MINHLEKKLENGFGNHIIMKSKRQYRDSAIFTSIGFIGMWIVLVGILMLNHMNKL